MSDPDIEIMEGESLARGLEVAKSLEKPGPSPARKTLNRPGPAELGTTCSSPLHTMSPWNQGFTQKSENSHMFGYVTKLSYDEGVLVALEIVSTKFCALQPRQKLFTNSK